MAATTENIAVTKKSGKANHAVKMADFKNPIGFSMLGKHADGTTLEAVFTGKDLKKTVITDANGEVKANVINGFFTIEGVEERVGISVDVTLIEGQKYTAIKTTSKGQNGREYANAWLKA